MKGMINYLKIENDKIISATEDELYSHYLSGGWDDIYPFDIYVCTMINSGVEIIKKESST